MKPVARRAFRHLWLVALLACVSAPLIAQDGWMPGQSIQWRRVHSPFTPGDDAIMGGPGNDPNPGAPMYVCRANVQGSLVPGKWVGGNCNVAFGGSENVMNSYEVAYGNARWGRYRGGTEGLVQAGHEADGSPLFSCRVHYVTNFPSVDYGYQPGKLTGDGTCHIPFGGAEIAQNPPFQVLYATDGGRPPYPYPNPNPPYPYPYPYPYPPQTPPQPLPGCRGEDPGVNLNVSTGHWEGPNCSPSDGFGNIAGPPRYADQEPSQPPAYQPNPNQPPPGPYEPGPSSVSWQQVQSPFQPGQGAIMGGPGNGPKPGAPLYVCRAYYNGALYPGKWVEGQCSIADGEGHEQKVNSYEVANGSAEWRNFDGNVSALVPGGYDADGTPLYICREKLNYWGNKGLQPGRLEGSQCHISYGGMDNVSGPPFDALYNVFPAGGASAPQQPQPDQYGPGAPQNGPPEHPAAPDQGANQPHGIQVTFTGGTGSTPGIATVTNGETGKTVTKPLPANSTPEQCVSVLQQAAFEAGLQIQAQPDGKGLKVNGINNAVHVTEASVSVSQY